MADIVTQPIKFLGATVLSFNTTLGLGAPQESTLNVDLVEDCEAGDKFLPAYNEIEVGAPVYFNTNISGEGFNFGGVLTNWTISQGGSGRTFNVKVVDPRQLLENTIVIVDSFVGEPTVGTNYFNVYAAYEKDVLSGNCSVFGSSLSTDRGMPYNKIIDKLSSLTPTICSPTGYEFTIDWDTFPKGVPSYYRVSGPSVTLLQLLQDVCNVLGLEFYTTLSPGGIISVGTIDLNAPPSSFSTIIGAFDGKATELSYGEELRNEKTKTLIFGEQQHYLSMVKNFNFYFGEEWDGNNFIPVIPFKWSKCFGFWIKKRIKDLNITLNKPMKGGDGPYTISEYDIKAAMASYMAWHSRIYHPVAGQIQGSLNKKVAETYTSQGKVTEALDAAKADKDIKEANKFRGLGDAVVGPLKARSIPELEAEDLQTIYNWVKNLGDTYYGKQYFTRIDENMCYYIGENFQEKVFSAIPTNAGAWVDYGTPVLGLADPDLGTFREGDERISTFAVFSIDDAINNPNIKTEYEKSKENSGGDTSYPEGYYQSNNSSSAPSSPYPQGS